jgi:hypothetical protein
MNAEINTDNNWTVVSNRRRKNEETEVSDMEECKIVEPCWFYNNGGCKHKDGTEKSANECKYLHVYSENVERPTHLTIRKPCDKLNLEGECKWNDNCKYSHKNLTAEEWCRYYPGIPYNLRSNIQKRQQLENKLIELEGRLKILEFKQDGMTRDIHGIVESFQSLVKQFKINKTQLPWRDL